MNGNFFPSLCRFEETNIHSLECKREANDTCIGGYARIVSIVKRLQKTRTNPIFLNAGDNFAGTIWYTFGKWNVTQHFLNMLKADVMVSFLPLIYKFHGESSLFNMFRCMSIGDW